MITKTHFSVRYKEIDLMGIVHHSRYSKWFERGRNDFLKKTGLPSGVLNAMGLYLPLTEMNCIFRSPAKFGDEITVVTSLIYMSYVRLKFSYTILDKSTEKVIATGVTTHAWTNRRLKPLNIVKTAPEVYRYFKLLVETSPKSTI